MYKVRYEGFTDKNKQRVTRACFISLYNISFVAVYFCTGVEVFTRVMSVDDVNDVFNNAMLRGDRKGSLKNPLQGQICIINSVHRTKEDDLRS